MTLLERIVHFYVASKSEFNGVPLADLLKESSLSLNDLKSQLSSLVSDGLISINFGETNANPHIKSFKPSPTNEQLKNLGALEAQDAEEEPADEPDIQVPNPEDPDGEPIRIVFTYGSKLSNICAYPERQALLNRPDLQEFEEEPFTLRLALGEPQFTQENFNLAVLESYRNDPRFHYATNDVGGTICIDDEYFMSDDCPESDKTLLEHFGFAYNEAEDRAVTAFLRDLSRLSSEHQRIWNAHRIKGEYFVHPDYARTVSGEWPENLSIFDAFLMELEIINGMCERMNKPPLFRNDPSAENRPREFAFLLRPTVKEYQGFIHLLDKLLSDSLNKDFFRGDINLTSETTRNDGTVETNHKGTIVLLSEWVRLKTRLPDPKPFDEAIQTLKDIRKARQPSAHSMDDNRFDRALFKQQRELMVRAYTAVRLLRLLFANHPAARNFPVPDMLRDGNIWTH